MKWKQQFSPTYDSLEDSLRVLRALENFVTRAANEHLLLRYKIILHRKYRDDGIIIFKGCTAELPEFFNLANDAHPLLKFTYEISNIIFLRGSLAELSMPEIGKRNNI